MPRDGSGVYSTPPGTHGTPNTTILSAAYNNNVDDVAVDLNTPRPIVAGGTGATTAAGAMAALGGVLKAGDSMTGALQINPAHALPGQWPLHVYGSNTASQSFGVLIDAGINATDQALLVRDNTGTKSYFYVTGSGVVTLPQSSAPNLLINTTGSRGSNAKVCLRYDNSAVSALEISTSGTADAGGSILSFMNSRDEQWSYSWAGGTQTQINVNGKFNYTGTLNCASLTATGGGNSVISVPNGAITVAGIILTTNTALKPGGGTWADSSDARTKTVLGDYQHGLAEITQLNPVRYQFKGNDGKPAAGAKPGDAPVTSPHGAVVDQEFIGLVAQEVEPVMPEMVSQHDGYIDGEPVTDMRELDTTPLIFALVNAVKTLAARIEALEGTARR